MARVTVSYPSGEKKSYASPEAAKADMASKGYKSYNDKVSGGGAGTKITGSGSGSSVVNLSTGNPNGGSAGSTGSSGTPSSVTINGKVVTDPQQVARITANQQAAARYAIQDYQSQGTPIPSNLRDEVNQIIADGSMPGVGSNVTRITGLRDFIDGGGLGTSGPTFQGGPFSGVANAVGLKPVAPAGTGTRLANGQLFLGGDTAWNDYTRRIQAADASVSAIRQSPSPGPNEFPGLGAPGKPREDNSGEVGLMGAMSNPAPAPETAAPPNQIDSTTAGGSTNGNEASNAPAEDGAAVSAMNAKRSQVPMYEQGGMVGPNGVPQRPSTATLDLPPSLARLLNMPMQSYAEGGMVGPGGVPQRPMTSPMAMGVAQQGGAPVVGMAPPGGQGRPLNFAAIDQQAQQFMQQNPQQVAQIRAEVEKSMAEGEIDAQGLNMFVQVATTALQNPEMWPQLRQVLIRQGMLDAEDIGEEYDQGFLIILYIIGKTMGGGQMTTPSPAGGVPTVEMEDEDTPMSAGQVPEMSMSKGGPLPAKSKNPDGSIPINAHEGEYIIPADVTRKLGTDHFDKMIAKARGMDGKGEQ